MARGGKYGQITTEHGDIPPDEPVFLLRAQDQFMLPALGAYLALCEQFGAPPDHIAAVRLRIGDIDAWQQVNPTKIPGSE